MRHPDLTRIDQLGNKRIGALSIPQNTGVVTTFFFLVLLKNYVAGLSKWDLIRDTIVSFQNCYSK